MGPNISAPFPEAKGFSGEASQRPAGSPTRFLPGIYLQVVSSFRVTSNPISSIIW